MALEDTPDLIEELTEALADVVSFYFRAHGAHWNVIGPDFSEYHNLFNEIYEDVYSSIDPLAENLRKLGAPAPFQLPAFIALGELRDANVGNDAKALAELDSSLRSMDAKDPVKYDFALFGLGVFENF